MFVMGVSAMSAASLNARLDEVIQAGSECVYETRFLQYSLMLLDRFWMFFMDFDGFLGTSTDMWPPTGHGGGILLLGADEAANSRLLMPGTRRFSAFSLAQ